MIAHVKPGPPALPKVWSSSPKARPTVEGPTAANGCRLRVAVFGFRSYFVAGSRRINGPCWSKSLPLPVPMRSKNGSMQPVRIKPPNDLILGGGKLAGFLLETSNRWDFQVLGVGINVRSAPEIAGYPTSSVEQFSVEPGVKI